MMSDLEHNRHSWNSGAMSTSVWAQPVDEATIAAARAGRWDVLLTPRTPVPKSWLSDIEGRDVLCLASGGGQQAPILSAAGARVVSFDLSDEQLRKDQFVAEREGLTIRCVRGDMANLECFEPASFDLIFHPASNVFAKSLAPIWRECYRVLRPGGALLCGFMNPTVFMFDHDEVEATGELTVRYSLPYSDEESLPTVKLEAKIEAGEPLEFSHSLASQIGGQTDAGFVIAGLYEDHWYDDNWPLSNRAPVSIATRAIRLPQQSPQLERLAAWSSHSAHTKRETAMPDRPTCIRTTNEASEHTHVYPQSSEPMGPVRRLGKVAGLERIGINIQRLPPGTRSSWPHAEENEEEFVYVIAGQVDAWIDGHIHPMQQGDLAAFPAGTGISHCFINNTEQEVVLLVGGEAPKPGSRIFYPLNPSRREDMPTQYWWSDVPSRELGTHDGLPEAQRTRYR